MDVLFAFFLFAMGYYFVYAEFVLQKVILVLFFEI